MADNIADERSERAEADEFGIDIRFAHRPEQAEIAREDIGRKEVVGGAVRMRV
jgi:hypothetical protein